MGPAFGPPFGPPACKAEVFSVAGSMTKTDLKLTCSNGGVKQTYSFKVRGPLRLQSCSSRFRLMGLVGPGKGPRSSGAHGRVRGSESVPPSSGRAVDFAISAL